MHTTIPHSPGVKHHRLLARGAILVIAWTLFSYTGLSAQAPDDDWSDPEEIEEVEKTDESEPISEPDIAWVVGPARVDIGPWASLSIPAAHRFAGEDDAVVALYEDRHPYPVPLLALEVGYIESLTVNADWHIVFTFDEIGFLEKSETDDLNANLILRSYQTEFEYENEWRREDDRTELKFIEWKIRPQFTANGGAEWAIAYQLDETIVVHYVSALPGRQGCMKAISNLNESQFESVLPKIQAVMNGFAFRPARAYSDYNEGDSVASYDFKTYLEDDIWTDERGGLHTVAAWFEKLVSVYHLDSPELWFESSESSPDTELESGPNTIFQSLVDFWYLLFIPIGVFALLKFNSPGGPKQKRYGRQ